MKGHEVPLVNTDCRIVSRAAIALLQKANGGIMVHHSKIRLVGNSLKIITE